MVGDVESDVLSVEFLEVLVVELLYSYELESGVYLFNILNFIFENL